MRMVLTSVTVLGLALVAMAATGISSLASDLERATPKQAAPTVIEVQTREVDCPLKEREPRRL